MSSPKVITCKAAVMYDYNEPLVVETVRIEPPKEDQVRIKLVSSGLCLTDVKLFLGKGKVEEAAHKLPFVLGHEGAGIVESVGETVNHLKPGDHVLTTFLPRCNNCAYCEKPFTNLCAKENFWSLGQIENRKLVSSDKGVQGFGGLGTFCEYLLLKQCQVEKIDLELPKLENLSIVCCAIGSGYFAATGRAKVERGSTVAIWDLSGFGINAAYGAKVAGAKHIIVIDSNESEQWKQLAAEFGVTELVNPQKLNKPVEQYLQDKYGGVDHAFDCNGDPESQVSALKSLSLSGEFTFVAFTESRAKVDVPVAEIFAGKAIAGSIYGKVRSDEAYKQVLNMYQIGKYPIEKLVTYKFPLEKINEAIQTVVDHKTIRTVITF